MTVSTSRCGQLCAFVTGLLVVLGASPAASQTRPPAPATNADLSSLLMATTRSVSPAVVQILTTAQTPGGAMVPRSSDLVSTQRGSGSGVIIDADGFIITNAHVVADALQLRVEIPVAATGH